jgi:flagellar biosynthesis protein FlhB
MADQDKDQKTHEPTQKKLDDARKKGEVATTPEMRHAVMFLAMFALLGTIGLQAVAGMGRLFLNLWGGADRFRIEPEGAQGFATGLFAQIGGIFAPSLGLLFGFATLIIFVQGRPSLSWSRLQPKWSKVSPVSGLGRMFGMRGFVEFLKTLAKCAMVITVVVIVLWPKAAAIDELIGMGPEAIARTVGSLVLLMLKAVLLLVGALALFDFLYQRRSFLQRMRMTLQEVKDEHKDAEGDPQIKARIRSIAIQRTRRRMMAAVPTASVVITNPTHYAVALRYDHGQMAAPVVVAKGADAIALKIREIAKGAGVPVMESPPLARALYASAEIDHPIPVEHYAAVAEIIGYVMRLARQRA